YRSSFRSFVLRPPPIAAHHLSPSFPVHRLPYIVTVPKALLIGAVGSVRSCREITSFPTLQAIRVFPFHSWRLLLTVLITRYHSVVSVVCVFSGYRSIFRRFSCPLFVDFLQCIASHLRSMFSSLNTLGVFILR